MSENTHLALTPGNYHSREANLCYYSVSQIKTFRECAARWYAKYVRGTWEDEEKDALLQSSYIDRALLTPEDLDAWCEQHKEFCYGSKKSNQEEAKKLKSVENLDLAVAAVQRQPLLMSYLEGQRQVILTGTLGGSPVKAMLDVLNVAKCRLVDLKAMASLSQEFWNREERRYENWIEHYGYWLQMAVYRELVRQRFGPVVGCFIVAVSKEADPDVHLYMLSGELFMQEQLTLAKAAIDSMNTLRQTDATSLVLEGCMKCAYCRKTQIIDKPTILHG